MIESLIENEKLKLLNTVDDKDIFLKLFLNKVLEKAIIRNNRLFLEREQLFRIGGTIFHYSKEELKDIISLLQECGILENKNRGLYFCGDFND